MQLQRDDLALALKLAQPCVMMAEYTPILVHYCFNDDHLFTYDCVSSITVGLKTGMRCALRGETLLRLVELAGEKVDLTPVNDDVKFKSGGATAMLPAMGPKDFLWKGAKAESGISFTFDDDLMRGWRLCSEGVAKDGARHQEWACLVLRTGPKALLAACDGAATVRYRLDRALGKKELTVLIPKSVVDQVVWIASLLECEPKQIKATLGEVLTVTFEGGKWPVQLVGKLLPEEPFDFDAALKHCEPVKQRQTIPDDFEPACSRVAAVRAKEGDKSCSLTSDGSKLRVHGSGALGNAETVFKFNGKAADVSCDPDCFTRYLGEVESITLSPAGVAVYAGEDKFAQFTLAQS